MFLQLFACLLYQNVSTAWGVTFASPKVTKKLPPDVRSTFCTKNFLKIAVGNIRDFPLRVPKTARQQREMIRSVLRQFLQKLLLQNLIPHFTADFILWETLCHRKAQTKNSKIGEKSLLSISAAGQCF